MASQRMGLTAEEKAAIRHATAFAMLGWNDHVEARVAELIKRAVQSTCAPADARESTP